jgi:hypothetical protein
LYEAEVLVAEKFQKAIQKAVCCHFLKQTAEYPPVRLKKIAPITSEPDINDAGTTL